MSERSPDLLEATRSAVEAANGRDFDTVESLYAKDAVLEATELGTFEGAAAIRSLYEEMIAPYGDVRTEIDEVVDLGSGVAFSVVTVVGRPHGSTAEVRFHYATVAVFADGVIVRQSNHIDIDVARAAAERLAHERA